MSELLLPRMKRTLFVLFVLTLSVSAGPAFSLKTPEEKRADGKWEKQLRREIDLEALHAFLVRTLAEHPRFEDVDLASAEVGDAWQVRPHRRSAQAGQWWFHQGEDGKTFELRYSPENKSRDVVLVCERKRRKAFRLLKITWAAPIILLSFEDDGVRSPTTTISTLATVMWSRGRAGAQVILVSSLT